MFFKANVSLLIFCLGDLVIHERGVLKSPTIIVWPSISPFVSVKVCFIYLGARVSYHHLFTWLRSCEVWACVSPTSVPSPVTGTALGTEEVLSTV